LHTFFGNVAADADSQLQDLLEQPTTCEQQLDTASYWAPALLDEGELITPEKSVAYYRAGLGVDPLSVKAFPAGLMMIAVITWRPHRSQFQWWLGPVVLGDSVRNCRRYVRPLEVYVWLSLSPIVGTERILMLRAIESTCTTLRTESARVRIQFPCHS